jgi:hypothetical protein
MNLATWLDRLTILPKLKTTGNKKAALSAAFLS